MISIILCLSLATTVEDEIDAASFGRLIGELYAPIRDFELYCEGNVTLFIDQKTQRRVPGHEQLSFQSNYAYRMRDGATYLDIYKRFEDPDRPMERWTLTLVDTKLTKWIRRPDSPRNRGMPVVLDGGSLHYTGSAEYFTAVPEFNDSKFRRGHPGYRYEGWEDIDGHRCLRISIADPPEAAAAGVGSVERFWVDLDRGGHMLRSEFYQNGDLWYRKENIRLGEFSTPAGDRVWFPVHGEIVTFVGGKGPGKEPISKESYDVVQGSLVFNQGLPDSRFSIDWDSAREAGKEFLGHKRAYDTAPKREFPPPPRTDPAGIQEDLERRLAEADQQARMLKASPPSSRSWNGATITKVVLIVFSIGAIVVSIILRRRA